MKHIISALVENKPGVLAHVFRVSSDPYVGKLCVFRVHQGTLDSSVNPVVDAGLRGRRALGAVGGSRRRGQERRAQGEDGAVRTWRLCSIC